MPRKTNPRANWKKRDYHSQNKSKYEIDDEQMNAPKPMKLKTSLQIYHRLMHDTTLNLDLHRVYIGYSDHVYGMQEMPLLNWQLIEKGGDIPMHHIFCFFFVLNNGSKLMLWHRKHRLDRLYGSGSTKKSQILQAMMNSDRIKAIQSQTRVINQDNTKPSPPSLTPSPQTSHNNTTNTASYTNNNINTCNHQDKFADRKGNTQRNSSNNDNGTYPSRRHPPQQHVHEEEKQAERNYNYRGQKQFVQTGLCKFYGAGYCAFGSAQCYASHNAEEIIQYEQDWLNGKTQPSGNHAPVPPIALPANFSLQRVSKQKYDYVLVLDLEGSEEIIELPCILIDLANMREVSRFHAWIRPTQWDRPGFIAKHKANDTQHINTKSTAIAWPLALQRLNKWLMEHGVVLDANGAQEMATVDDNDETNKNRRTSVRTGKTFLVAICGNWDAKTQIVKQCNICNVAMPFYFNRWMNIKDFALSIYPQFEAYQVKGMAPLLRTLKMPLHGTHHLGMDDTYNIARIIIRFAMDKAVFDYTAFRHSWDGKVFYSNNQRRVSRYHTSMPSRHRNQIYHDLYK